MNFSMMLDILVAGLSVATIVYAMLLSRRLGALRNDKEQLEALVQALDQSASRAEAGIRQLKEAADQIGRELEDRVEQGKGLRTDLTYMIDIAGTLADRLETGIRFGRDDGKPSAPPAAEPLPRRGAARASSAEPRVAPESRAEPRITPDPRVTPDPRATPNPRVMVEREDAPAGKAEPRVTGFPSRAERLLRRALEARR